MPWNADTEGGGQHLEQPNVERPIFRNYKIANIKITEDELFDNFIFEFDFLCFRNHLNGWGLNFQTVKFKNG